MAYLEHESSELLIVALHRTLLTQVEEFRLMPQLMVHVLEFR